MSLRAWCPLLALALAPPAGAQEPPPELPWSWRAPAADAPYRQDAQVSPAGAAAASLVLPGFGQHRLGQVRKWVYWALEATAWALHLERRARGGELRDRYRDLAWAEARHQLGPRTDGDFGYYEVLAAWTRSGEFDHDPTSIGVQPEDDPASYNGFIWERARAIYFPAGQMVGAGDDAWTRALDYYVQRAYGPGFLWDWSSNPQAREELAELIERSDARFRQATTALGAVLLNHFISAVDAYTTARARRVLPARVRFIPDVPRGRVILQVTMLTGR